MATLLILAALTAPATVETAHFDRIDVNHVYREDGELCFTQLIFWRWCREDRRFYSFGYKMLRDGQKHPRFNGRHWTVQVKRGNVDWRVTADCVIEWHSSYDPEVLDRQRWPNICREW